MAGRRSGRRATPLAWMFHVAIYGTEGYAEAEIGFTDRYALFRNAAQEMVRFMTTGRFAGSD